MQQGVRVPPEVPPGSICKRWEGAVWVTQGCLEGAGQDRWTKATLPGSATTQKVGRKQFLQQLSWGVSGGFMADCASPASLRLFFSPTVQHLQHHEISMEGESCYYHCILCSYSTKAKLNLLQHVRSMKHQRSESLRKLQRLQKGLPEEEDEDLAQIFTLRKCPAPEAAGTAEVGVDRQPCWAGLWPRAECRSTGPYGWASLTAGVGGSS
uniref:Uncharacterized protein n=1 Tax=Sphaerodactylus townsendi TaxID=933632 RepID=A0ACB8EB62_9SAUR